MDDFDADDKSNRLFILSWDQLGLEACIDVTAKSQEFMLDTLQSGGKFTTWLGSTLNSISLRARFNPQRYYEIYSLTTDYDMDEEMIRAWFEDCPQEAADLVRERGHKIQGDRQKADAIKIR
jgi:hypothetical protein